MVRVLITRPAPPRMVVRAARKTALQQKIGELIQQVLQVQGVEDAAFVLAVGGEAHESKMANPREIRHYGRMSRTTPPEGFAEALLAHYDANKRDLPWRRTSDPYRIWISE